MGDEKRSKTFTKEQLQLRGVDYEGIINPQQKRIAIHVEREWPKDKEDRSKIQRGGSARSYSVEESEPTKDKIGKGMSDRKRMHSFTSRSAAQNDSCILHHKCRPQYHSDGTLPHDFLEQDIKNHTLVMSMPPISSEVSKNVGEAINPVHRDRDNSYDDIQPNYCKCGLLSLPDEIFIHIFSHLEPQELSKVALINHQLKMLSEDDCLWRLFCEQRWPKSSLYHSHSYDSCVRGRRVSMRSWKQIYLHKSRVDKTWMSPTYRPKVSTLEGHTDDVLKIRFNERFIVSGSQDRSIKVWSVDSNKCIRTINGHRGNVYCVRFNDDKIVSCSQDQTVKVWDMETGKCTHTLRGHTDKVWCVRFDDSKIVSGSFDHTLKMWDARSNKCYQTLNGHTYYVYDLQYDDDKIISCSAHPDNTIRIWDLAMGAPRKVLSGHTHYVYCLQYDDEKIISGSGDQKIKIWDMNTGACTDTLLGHGSPVWTVQFDENKIVSASADHSIKIWDINTKKVVNTLYGHSQSIWTLQFDDEKIVTGSIDRTIKIWNFRGGEDPEDNDPGEDSNFCWNGRGDLSGDGMNNGNGAGRSTTPYAGFRQKKYTDPKKKRCDVQ